MFNNRFALTLSFFLLASPIDAAMAYRASSSLCNSATGTTSTAQFGAALGIGDLLFATINDATDETTAITSVADDVNGAWTLLTGPQDHASATVRVWTYYYQNNSSTGQPIVTVTFNTSIIHRLCVAAFSGAATSGGPDVIGTSRLTSSSGDTTHTSNSITLTGAGGIISGLFFNATKVATAGSDEINVTNANTRAHIFFTAHASGTSRTHVATSATGNHSSHVITAWLEAGGSATPPKKLMTLGAGDN